MYTNPTNIDTETGVHYGMISIHSLADWVLEEVYQNGKDLRYTEIREDLKSAIQDAVHEWRGSRSVDHAIEDLIDACMEAYEGSSDVPYYYETEENGEKLVVQTSELGLWVFKSPVIRRAPLCSPCVPNAGDLDGKIGSNSVLTYALPLDWLSEDAQEREKQLASKEASAM